VVTTEAVCEMYHSSIVDCAGKNALFDLIFLKTPGSNAF